MYNPEISLTATSTPAEKLKKKKNTVDKGTEQEKIQKSIVAVKILSKHMLI